MGSWAPVRDRPPPLVRSLSTPSPVPLPAASPAPPPTSPSPRRSSCRAVTQFTHQSLVDAEPVGSSKTSCSPQAASVLVGTRQPACDTGITSDIPVTCWFPRQRGKERTGSYKALPDCSPLSVLVTFFSVTWMTSPPLLNLGEREKSPAQNLFGSSQKPGRPRLGG
jgi:hypothetical protein